MNADYLGHYYQYYYPTTANYYAAQKLGYYPTSSVGNNWHDYSYMNSNALLHQEYISESAARLQLTELMDASSNNTISNQLSMAHLISNGYPVPVSSSNILSTIPATIAVQSLDSCDISTNVNINNNTNITGENQPDIYVLEPPINEISKSSNINNLNIPIPVPITEILNSNKSYDSNQYYCNNQISQFNNLTSSYTELNPQSNYSAFIPNMYNNSTLTGNHSAAIAASAYAAVAVGTAVSAAASSGFNFLSEVANTLLGQ